MAVATTTARFTVFLVFLATHRLDIVEYVLLLYQIFKLINGMEWNEWNAMRWNEWEWNEWNAITP
jgi:hypothetical protein